MLKKILHNRFLQGSFIITVSSFLLSLLNYGFNLIVARSMSLSDYGEYASVLSYVILFTIPFGAFGTILIRKLGTIDAQHRQAFGREIETWLFQKVFRGLPVIILLSIIGYFFLISKSNLQAISIFFILFMIVITLLQTIYTSAFQAYKAFFIYGAYLTGLGVIKLLSGIILVRMFPNLQLLYMQLFAIAIIQVVVGHWLLVRTKQSGYQKLTFAPIWSYLKRRSVYIPLLATLGLIGIANIDIILVKKFMSSSDAGLYGATTLLAKIILYVTSPIASVGYIFFTGKENKHHANHILALIATGTILCGVAAILFYSMFSDFMIHLFFDQRFASIENILWLGGIYGTLYSLVTLFSYYFVAKNSWLSLTSLFCLIGQMIGITFFHNSLAQVLIVNSSLLLILVIAYMIGFAINSDSRKPHIA